MYVINNTCKNTRKNNTQVLQTLFILLLTTWVIKDTGYKEFKHRNKNKIKISNHANVYGPITKWHWPHKIYLDGHTQMQYVLSKYNNTTDGHTVVRVKVTLGTHVLNLEWGWLWLGMDPVKYNTT